MKSDSCQFLKLYKNKSNILGWLNTYPDIDPLYTVEQWAIKLKSDLKLYNCSFFSRQMSYAVPSNDAEWETLIKKGPAFEAYIKRISRCYEYETFVEQENIPICSLSGNSVFGIYNDDVAHGKGELVQITLLSDSGRSEDGVDHYKQITLMKTMEVQKPWLTVSLGVEIGSPITFGDFISNGGIISDIFRLEKNTIAFINFETVYSQDWPPIN
jgi:hypothetical protein